ncbi:MAG: hypothetical protein DMF60_18415 [Acidobacteria bacterium]|nr:MAG: hypothetical protein DMF60_18415 [Acidobacteriota bacterium]
MTNKKVTLISLIGLLLAAIGGWQLAMFSAHASGGSIGARSQDSPAPTAPAAPTFEYKILIFLSSQAFVRPTGNYDNRGRPIMTQPPFLEDEINKLAAQGYVVESFQRESPPSGTGYEGGSFIISSSSEIVVLLKREKK